MKRLILLLFLAISGYLIAQDIKPINPEFKMLQTPNNAVFWYNPVDSFVWVYKGQYGWTRLLGETRASYKYVPYNGAIKDVNLGDRKISSTKQRLPLFNGACQIPTILDNGDGSISVGDGEYHVSTNVEGRGSENFAITGGTFTLTDNTTNYLVADYNSGTPILRVTNDVNEINETTIVPIYTAYRNGNYLHFQNWDALGVALANKVHQSIVKTQRYRRESGLSLSEYPNRYLALSSGRVWIGAVPVSVSAIATSTDNLFLYYHSGGVWTSTVTTQYNNTQYDNGTNLVTLTANRYAVNWIFRGIESQKHLYVILGTGDYTLAQAQEAVLPAAPTAITSHSMLVGKLIVQRDATTATAIQSAFDTQFSTATPNAHNDLTGRDATDVHPASSVTNTPVGTITTTTVQASINYLDGKDVSTVSVTGTGTKTITVARVNGSTLTATFEDAGGTQLQSDWTQTNTTSVDYIKNKPTALSNFTNDLNFIGDAPANGYMYGRKNNAWDVINVTPSQWTTETFGISYSTGSVAMYANNNSYASIITNPHAGGSGLFVSGGYGTSDVVRFIDGSNSAGALVMNITGAGNVYMPKLASKSSETNVVWFDSSTGKLSYGAPSGGSGGGDVFGPSSSTDNALVRFDGTTGKLIQNSTVLLTDAGALSGITSLTASGAIYSSGSTVGSYGNLFSSTGNVTAGSSGSTPITLSSSGLMAMKGITAPSAPISGAGLLYAAGSSGYEHIYFKTANETFDLTQIGTGLTNPMTSIGDMIYGTTGGAAARLAAGADGYYLRMQSGVPTWVASSYTLPTASNSVLGGVKISSTDGGISMYGDYAALNINNLTTASLDLSDYFAFYDGSGTATRKATLNDLKTLVGSGSTGGAPADATYITQTANASLSNEQALGSLATGIMKSTNTTGVVSTVPAPNGDVVGTTDSQILTNKTINGSSNTLSNVLILTTTGTSGAATYNGTTLNIPQYEGTGGGMVYPSAGIALSTGSAWGTSITDNSANWNTAYTDRLKWDGGSTGLVASTGRTSLGGTTIGQSMFTLTNPSATTFPRFNSNNTVSALTAADFRTAIGAGTGNGTVTSFSAGDLSPLFTTTETNATTTPDLSFTLSNAAAYTVFGNQTGSSAAPSYGKLSISTINATGTPSASTYLRGDGSWATVSGGSSYWQSSTGYIAPLTISDEVRIGSITDLGSAKLQVTGDVAINTDAETIVLSTKKATGTGKNLLLTTSYAITTGNTNACFGSFSLESTTTGSNNVAVGAYSMSDNTTGSSNTAVGSGSMETNIGGYSNSAIGYFSLRGNTSGYENTSIGEESLYNNTSGQRNSAVGSKSLLYNATGSNNIAIGYYAGNEYDGGSVLAPSGCIYIGNETQSGQGFSPSNEIVIGNGSMGLGSNSTLIGNFSTTKTFLYGNVESAGSVKVSNDSSTATAANVGAIRYRTSGNNSYCEMVMQTGASTYAWVIIKQNTW